MCKDLIIIFSVILNCVYISLQSLRYENGRLEKEVDRLTDINNDLEQTASHLNEENNRLEGKTLQRHCRLNLVRTA